MRRVERLGVNGEWLRASAILSSVQIPASKVEMNKMWWPYLTTEAAMLQIPKAGGGGDATAAPVALFEISHRLGLATLAVVEGLYRRGYDVPTFLELRVLSLKLFAFALVGMGQAKRRFDVLFLDDTTVSVDPHLPPEVRPGGSLFSGGSPRPKGEDFQQTNWLSALPAKVPVCLHPVQSRGGSSIWEPASSATGEDMVANFAAAVRGIATTDKDASKLFDFSPLQARQEDSSHSPAAASELQKLYEDWGWDYGARGGAGDTNDCIDLLGTAGAVAEPWSCAGKEFDKDDEAPDNWDQVCVGTGTGRWPLRPSHSQSALHTVRVTLCLY